MLVSNINVNISQYSEEVNQKYQMKSISITFFSKQEWVEMKECFGFDLII